MSSEPILSYSESIDIRASASDVWKLVTDMERYGEWSSENTGGYWRKNADGVPGTGEIGDEFVGINRKDGEEWKKTNSLRSTDLPKAILALQKAFEFTMLKEE